MTAPVPDWRLPPGVSRGAWEYIQSPHVAENYDADLVGHGLCAFDWEVAQRHLPSPGVLVDLGCGTGRLALAFARRGFTVIAVDLSREMLRMVGEKATRENLPVARLRANLTELDCLANHLADGCLCMFSTLGMLHGREARRAALRHAARILKPGGKLILHVHNRWRNFWHPEGRRWLIHNAWQALCGKAAAGDKYFEYMGIPNFYLHIYTRRELSQDLASAGLAPRHWYLLNADNSGALRCPWWLGRLRANGWIVVCETATDR